jgi:hypothetical protein
VEDEDELRTLGERVAVLRNGHLNLTCLGGEWSWKRMHRSRNWVLSMRVLSTRTVFGTSMSPMPEFTTLLASKAFRWVYATWYSSVK